MDAKIKDALKKIFEKLNIKDAKFTEVTLADGTKLSYEGDMPAMGMPVMLDGNPAPDGEYTMPDGSILVVSGGMIAEIKAMEDMNNDAANAELQEMLDWLFGFRKTEAPELLAKFKALEDNSTATVNALTEQLKAANDKIKSIEETASQMFTLVEKIAGLPAVESAFRKKEGFPDPKSLKTMADIKAAADNMRKQFNSSIN